MGSTTATQYNNIIEFLPVYYATLSANLSANGKTLTFAAVPAGVADGMFASYKSGNDLAGPETAVKVVSHDGTTVTLDAPLASFQLNSTTGIFFTPPIRAAQIWTKDMVLPLMDGVTVVAGETTMKLPGNGLAVRGFSTPAARVAQGAYGVWPADWLYAARDTLGSNDGSELDIYEFQNSSTLDSRVFWGFNHGTAASVNFFKNLILGGTWANGYFYGPTDFSGLSEVKVQFIWTPDRIYRYWDGVLYQADTYLWGSQRRAQWGDDLAVGSLNPAFAGNLTYPVAASNFDFMQLRIRRKRLWAF